MPEEDATLKEAFDSVDREIVKKVKEFHDEHKECMNWVRNCEGKEWYPQWGGISCIVASSSIERRTRIFTKEEWLKLPKA